MIEKNKGCPFCDTTREILLESEMCFAIYDKFPVNSGHVLVIPERHVGNYFDLNQNEMDGLCNMQNDIKSILEQKFNPDGFNVGFNVGESAGQTINHVHIHIIPRFAGDMEDPTGGVRHVIPGRGYYKL